MVCDPTHHSLIVSVLPGLEDVVLLNYVQSEDILVIKNAVKRLSRNVFHAGIMRMRVFAMSMSIVLIVTAVIS